MVDQPEGRPKSPGPGKVKVTKKHSVSKPYERPSSSRSVLATVKDLITPLTPAWLKDLVLRPPQTTSVTDALEQTVAEVQAVDDKHDDFKRTLKTLSLPVTGLKSEKKLPITSERLPKPPTSILDVTNMTNVTLDTSKTLEETLGDIKWSTIRPAVKEKYCFSLTAFNTPSKSPNLSSISIHNKSLNRSTNASPFTNRSRVSFGGTSLQRSLMHSRSNNTPVQDDKKPIKVKPITRSGIRPGVTSNTAKKILEQLESLSRPLGHLPSSRPSTPSSRPCSRASTPMSLSRPSTPLQHQPYAGRVERAIPIRSLTSTPQDRADNSFGGKIKREKTKHYSRVKEEEEEELTIPDFQTVSVPELEFKPIQLDTDHKPIKIVNQAQLSQQKDCNHVMLKDAIQKTIQNSISSFVKKSPSPVNEDNSSEDSSFSFSAPITVTNSALSTSTVSDSAEFSFGAPVWNKEDACKSVEDILREEGKVESKVPPGSWSCRPCKLSNPTTMTRCSGCEAPNPLFLSGLTKINSPIGIKRAPITPMKPACSPKQAKQNPVSLALSNIKEEHLTEAKPLVSFSLPKDQLYGEAAPTISSKLANLDNPLLKFKKTNNWTCDTCMLSNPTDLAKCQACQTSKPCVVTSSAVTSSSGAVTSSAVNPLLAFAKPAGWNCDTCMLHNDVAATKCKACETPKPSAAKSSAAPAKPTSVFQTLGSFKQSGWSCSTCMLTNSEDLQKCKACQTLKPGVKEEDVKVEKKKEEDKPSLFKFGAGAVSSVGSKPGFGVTLSGGFDLGNKGEGSKTAGFVFGATKKEDKPSTFGFASTDNKTDAKPTFSFGAAPVMDKPAFGAEAAKSDAAFNFGGKAEKKADSATNPATFNFGASTEKKADSTTPAFNFGGTTTVTKAADASAPSFSFGGSGTTKAEPATTGAFSFGSTTTPAFSFGGASEKKSTAPTFSFGGTKPTESAAKPAFNFGGTPATKTETTFGGASTTAFQFSGPNTMEGNQDSCNTMDASSQSPKAFQFEQQKPAAAPNGPSFNFGGSNDTGTKAAFPAPTSFSFAPTSTAPSFGAAATPAPFNFGQSKSTTSTFGQASNATPAFNFGGTAPPAQPATGFNFSATPQPAATFNFGGAPAPNTTSAAPAFNFGGGSSTFGSTAPTDNKAFSFGGNTAPAPAFGAANPPAPSFGNAAPAPSFNFGGAPAPANNAFQFGGTPATPSQNNMFNPVSSSTSGRKIRKAVRRTKR